MVFLYKDFGVDVAAMGFGVYAYIFRFFRMILCVCILSAPYSHSVVLISAVLGRRGMRLVQEMDHLYLLSKEMR